MRMQSQRGFLTTAREPGLVNKYMQTFPPHRAITLPQKKTQTSYDHERHLIIKRKATLKD